MGLGVRNLQTRHKYTKIRCETLTDMEGKQMEKRIITAAITGSIHTPTMTPYLPITPKQIAECIRFPNPPEAPLGLRNNLILPDF